MSHTKIYDKIIFDIGNNYPGGIHQMKKTRYIAVPTKTLSALHGVEVQIFLALLFLCEIKHTYTLQDVTYKVLESMTGINRAYISNIMQRLVNAGYIHKRATKHIGYRRDWSADNCVCNGPLEISVTQRSKIEKYALLPCDKKLCKLNGNTLLVFIYIIVHAKKECFCYPSLTQICEATGLSRTTVIKCIGALNSKGYIIKTNYFCKNGAHGHNRFIIADRVHRRFGRAFLMKMQGWLNYAQSVSSDIWNNIVSALKGNTYCRNLLENKIIPTVCFIGMGSSAAKEITVAEHTPDQLPSPPATKGKRRALPNILKAVGDYVRRKMRCIREKIRYFFKI